MASRIDRRMSFPPRAGLPAASWRELAGAGPPSQALRRGRRQPSACVYRASASKAATSRCVSRMRRQPVQHRFHFCLVVPRCPVGRPAGRASARVGRHARTGRARSKPATRPSADTAPPGAPPATRSSAVASPVVRPTCISNPLNATPSSVPCTASSRLSPPSRVSTASSPSPATVPGGALDALRVCQAAAEHLVAAAQPQDAPAPPPVCQQVPPPSPPPAAPPGPRSSPSTPGRMTRSHAGSAVPGRTSARSMSGSAASGSRSSKLLDAGQYRHHDPRPRTGPPCEAQIGRVPPPASGARR